MVIVQMKIFVEQLKFHLEGKRSLGYRQKSWLVDAIECLQNQTEQMGKYQCAELPGYKRAAVLCLGDEMSTVINLQRQKALKFDFKEMVKYDCESYRAQ